MKQSIEYLKQFILSQNLIKVEKKELLQHIKAIEGHNCKNDEACKAALKEKEALVDALNDTVKELEVKNRLIKLQENRENDAIFKEKLLANVSHELRTPLNAIIGMGHLLHTTTLDEQQQEFVDVINTGADSLLMLINDLLELSSLREQAIHIQEKPFSIDQLLTNLHRLVWFKTNEKQLQFDVKNNDKLPSYLLGDSSRLHQILLKLLSNAIKFTPKGKVSLEVKILHENSDKAVLKFIVKDTGIGIAPNKIRGIFDSFTKAHNVELENKVYEGTGTGLSIVKYLAKIMNGKIFVESKLGEGSEFTLVIPFKVPEQEVVDIYLKEKKLVASGGWHGKKVLYIEDNDANIFYLKNMLSSYPLELDIAEDLIQAQSFLSKKNYDCILSDVKLPDGNGIDFIFELRKNKTYNSSTPVIVITAGATDSERHKAQSIGIEGYISKPFTPETLFGELNRLFQAKSNLNALLEFYKKSKKITKKKPKKNTTIGLPNLHKVMSGNKTAMVEMIDIFLKQVPSSTKKIKQFLGSENWKNVHFEAHKLKSTVGIIGLEKLHQIIITINEYTRASKNLHLVPGLFQDFEEQLKVDLEIVHAERKRLTKRSKKGNR